MDKKKPLILIVDDEKSIRDSLTLVLKDIAKIDTAADGEEALLKAKNCDICLLDIKIPKIDGMEVLKRIKKLYPQVDIIMITATTTVQTAVEALKIGAHDYITKPFDVQNLLNTINNLIEKRKTEVLKRTKELFKKVVAVFGNKGGIGKTMFAVNLSLSLIQNFNQKTILIDAVSQFGNAALFLDMNLEKTLADFVLNSSKGESLNLDDFIFEHKSGLKILGSSSSPEDAKILDAEVYKKAINSLKDSFDFLIFDLDPQFDEKTSAVLDASDIILYLTDLSIPAVKNTSLGLEVMRSLYYSPAKIKMICNHTSSFSELKEEEIKEYLRCDLTANIPYEPKVVPVSINKGEPFIINNNENSISENINKIAQMLLV